MERCEFGKFYAATYDGKIFEFIVYDNNTIDCPKLNLYSFKKIELKPRFVMWNEKREYKYSVPANHNDLNSQLIGIYDIDEDLFEYLKLNRMIRYSTDMAYLYGFKDKNGYDSVPNHYGVGSPYKWAKKKGPILVKQRKGQFN